MSRLRAVAAALTLGTPFVATAADITRVASSFEDDDPFGLFVDVGFEHTQRRTKILRECLNRTECDSFASKQLLPVRRYTLYDTRLNIDVAAGISRDVEFSFGMPVVLFRYERLYADEFEPTSGGGLLSGPRSAYRAGLGNARFGLAWAVFNQKKDDTKPTWVVRVDYEAPTAPLLNPSLRTNGEGDPWSAVGDRVHKYTLSTALSREIGVAEPYFKAYYTIPVRGPGAYSNCDGKKNMGEVTNCGTENWSRKETGIDPPHMLGVLFGSEFEVYNRQQRKIDLDVRAIANYVSAGRYYNELSVTLQKLLTTGDYLQVGGRLALKGWVNKLLSVRVSGQLLYNTDHTLTDEQPGEDTDGDGEDNVTGNPNYNPEFDGVSRRFSASQSKDLRFDVTAIFTF